MRKVKILLRVNDSSSTLPSKETSVKETGLLMPSTFEKIADSFWRVFTYEVN